MDVKYQVQLMAERDNLDPNFQHATRLITQELERLERGESENQDAEGGDSVKVPEKHADIQLVDIHISQPSKVALRIRIPVKDYPKFNFVGKLLGPQGSTLKRLQQETGTKMSILGRGSMRNRVTEEEKRKEGGKFSHLNHELHIMVEVYTEISDAYGRMSHALMELKKHLLPDPNDEIGLEQRQEMMFINGAGGPQGGPPPMRGRGAPRGMGGGQALLATPMHGGRGAPMGGRGVASPRGSAPRGAPPSRGGIGGPPPMRGISGRGGPPRGRGSVGGPPRGRGAAPPPISRGMQLGRGAPSQRGVMRPPIAPIQPQPLEETHDYFQSSYEDPYGVEVAPEPMQEDIYGGAGDTQYFDYGHGSSAADQYQEDPYAAQSWESPSPMKAPPPRTRGSSSYRAHPYDPARPTHY